MLIILFSVCCSAGPVKQRPFTIAVGTLLTVQQNASKFTGTRNTKSYVVEKGNLLQRNRGIVEVLHESLSVYFFFLMFEELFTCCIILLSVVCKYLLYVVITYNFITFKSLQLFRKRKFGEFVYFSLYIILLQYGIALHSCIM